MEKSKRVINQSILDLEFKQDFINVDNTVAISSNGIIFKVGDVVKHDDPELKDERATITKFSIDKDTFDVVAHTEKGWGRISYFSH